MNRLSPIVKFVNGDLPTSQTTKGKKRKASGVACVSRPVIDLLNSECLLDNLFPIAIKGDFLKKHFKSNPLVTRGNKECLSELKELLFNLDVSELIRSSASERIHVWLSQRGSEGALESISVDDHEQAIKLYWAGHSIYCRAPLELEKSVVPHLLNDVGLGVAGSGTDKYRRGEIELFLSRKGHNTGIMQLTIAIIRRQISNVKVTLIRILIDFFITNY